MPRRKGDRPDVIPDGCVNFAFLGQFAETPRDTTVSYTHLWQLTIPPVTTFPVLGSRLQILVIYGMILLSRVVIVADSQFVFAKMCIRDRGDIVIWSNIRKDLFCPAGNCVIKNLSAVLTTRTR